MVGGGDDLKLLGTWSSPFAIRVKLALDLKGLSYEYAEEDLASKSELLLSSNPVHKEIPVLIHNGVPVCESNLIVEYIDEAFAGPSILPADPYERATARFWAAYVDDKVYLSSCISLAFCTCFDCSTFLITMVCAAPGVVGHDSVQGEDGGGEIRGEEGTLRGVGDPGGGPREVLRWEGVLRR
jgi:hypothetical protein